MSHEKTVTVPARCPYCSASTQEDVWWCPQCYEDLRPKKEHHRPRHARPGPADVLARPDGNVTTDEEEAKAVADELLARLAGQEPDDPAAQLSRRLSGRGSRAFAGLLGAAVMTMMVLGVLSLAGLFF